MLFNTKLFNTGLFNGGVTNNTVLSTDRIVFDGFSLSDGTTMVLSEVTDSGPLRELPGGRVPRGHGEYLTGDYFRSRVLEARGVVLVASLSALDTQLDTIRKRLSKREG